MPAAAVLPKWLIITADGSVGISPDRAKLSGRYQILTGESRTILVRAFGEGRSDAYFRLIVNVA